MGKPARRKIKLTKLLRWDSSDPDRAPPPLPLNPTSKNASPVRPNTGSTVAAAAQALVERARENAGPSHYMTNMMKKDNSPEKSPSKTPQHRRLQSLQNPNLKEFRASLDSVRPVDWTSSRSATPSPTRDLFNGSVDRSPSRNETPTPVTRDFLRDTPSLKPTPRSGPKPILGENTPPSATMLAIQNMPRREVESPLADITNHSTPTARYSQIFDGLYSQMHNLTTIATTLQKEMNALSRRSKDNATDLISLKEATKSRDEDIRKSLRELVTSSRTADLGLWGSPRSEVPRAASAMDFSTRFLDVNSHSSPTFGKSISLPKIPSIDDQDRASSPSPYSVQGASTMSMLEKIIREMATKEGQERLLTALAELLEKSGQESKDTAKKVEELAQLIGENQTSRALVRHNDSRRLSGESEAVPNSQSGRSREFTNSAPPAAMQNFNIVNNELRHYLQKLKESVAQGGGLTGEVKSLVRELRGEVLGMGRELGKRIDHLSHAAPNDRALVLAEPGRDDLKRLVQEGLADLKDQMEQVIDAKRRHSAGSTLSRRSVDSSDVHALVKRSLEEQGLGSSTAVGSQIQELDYDKMIAAVNDAFDAHPFEPEVKVEYLGLDRDEILHCLKEGMREYQSTREAPDLTATTKEEIFDIVQQAMQNFSPPAASTELSEVKQELALAVKDCLEDFKQNSVPTSMPRKPGDITKDDILEAVREGLGVFKKEGAREIDINRDDLFEAVSTGLDNLGYGDEVLQSLHEIVERVRIEFKEYSAANGRDTELVLDATKDGLESLRSSIETYVDRARDVTGKDEILGTLREGLDNIQRSIEQFSAHMTRNGGIDQRSDLADYIKTEFSHLHEAIGEQSRTLDNSPMTKEQIIMALTAGVAELKAGLGNREFEGPTDEVLEAMKEEFDQLREALLHGTAAHKEEILEAIQDHMGNLQSQSMDRGLDRGMESDMASRPLHNVLQTMKEEFESLKASFATPVVHSGTRSLDSESPEVLQLVRDELEQLRSSINNAVVPGTAHSDSDVLYNAIRNGFEDVRSQLDSMQDPSARPALANEGEILQTLNAGISSLRADIERLKTRTGDVVLADDEINTRDFAPGSQNAPSVLKKEDIEKLEVALTRLHIKVEALDQNIQASTPVRSTETDESNDKEALTSITSMIGELQNSVASLVLNHSRSMEENASKEDTDALETLLMNTKAKINDVVIPCLDGMATHDQISSVEAVVRLTGESIDSLTSKFGDNVASKDDVAAVYVLLEQTSSSLRDMRERQASNKAQQAAKDDLEALTDLCKSIEGTVDDLPTLDELASKEDLDNLNTLVKNFKGIHEDFKRQYESDLEVTAQAFDDRKGEAAKILEQLNEVKEVVSQSKDELKSRMRRGNEDVRALDEILQVIEEKIDAAPNAVEGVQEVLEIITREFDRASDANKDLLSDHEEKFAALAHKHDEVQGAIIAELAKKLDLRFAEIMSRHDEQQATVEQAAQIIAGKAVQQDEVLQGSRAVAEDLRLSIDTLGASITAINPTLREATEKMSDDSKTVFNKVSDVHSRLDANHVDVMTEHELTRQEIAKSLNGVGSLREEFSSFHPQATEALTNLLALAAEHYEHSKRLSAQAQPQTNSASIEDIIRSGFASLPRLEAPPSGHAAYDDTEVKSRLDRLIQIGKYDDAGKLDQLLAHATESSKHAANLAKLDMIHQQVLSTAAEVSAFVLHQRQLIAPGHEDKVGEAREAAAEVDLCRSEKEDLELKIKNLTLTRSSLSADVERLMADRETLTSQKSRLGAELSSIETALKIRREELQMMDARADALERRIIEGVMDHSRALLIAKQPRGPVNMSLKRVGSNTSSTTASTATPSSTAANALNMALKKNGVKKSATVSHPSSRRILSLGQITGNTPGGSSVVSPVPRTHAPGLNNLKRSQSVRDPAMRKVSWAGRSNVGEYDKENGTLSEEDEEEDYEESRSLSDRMSGTAMSVTDRSSSYTGTQISSGSDRRTSYRSGPSEYSYMTGSYITGTGSDRTSSFGSTIRSTIGGERSLDESTDGEEEDERSERDHGDEGHGGQGHETALTLRQPEVQEDGMEDEATDGLGDLPKPASPTAPASKRPIIRVPDGYDSGLGSDLPTAPLSSSNGSDYFRSAMDKPGGT